MTVGAARVIAPIAMRRCNSAPAPPLDFSEFDLAANFGLLPIGS
jgi:hypothetical protein